MKNALTPIAVFLISFSLFACLQDEESDNRIPVRYTVIVTNKISGESIKDASVELTNENQMSQNLKTNSSGIVTFPSEESYVNQIVVSKKGYLPKDTVDIISNPDTVLSVILRSISIYLVPIDSVKCDSIK